MKRRLFLKGLASLPLGLGILKSINTKPIKPKVEIAPKGVDIKNTISDDGGYYMSKEMSDAFLKVLYKNSRQIKTILK